MLLMIFVCLFFPDCFKGVCTWKHDCACSPTVEKATRRGGIISNKERTAWDVRAGHRWKKKKESDENWVKYKKPSTGKSIYIPISVPLSQFIKELNMLWPNKSDFNFVFLQTGFARWLLEWNTNSWQAREVCWMSCLVTQGEDNWRHNQGSVWSPSGISTGGRFSVCTLLLTKLEKLITQPVNCMSSMLQHQTLWSCCAHNACCHHLSTCCRGMVFGHAFLPGNSMLRTLHAVSVHHLLAFGAFRKSGVCSSQNSLESS